MTTILNLGCGTRTSPAAVNIDWSIYLRLRRSKTARVLAPVWLRGSRLEAFERIDGDIVVHDLRRGIPADTGSADAVYHSHVLEHIDREQVPGFMAEIRRVLKPGGIQRVVVPDFGRAVAEYAESLANDRPGHDDRLVPILAQSVRRESHGSSLQPPWRRRIENVLLGDARRRGETHQWAYDRLNLQQVLEANGFVDFEVRGPGVSDIEGWAGMGLEVDLDGTVYKPGSLWAEARKP